MGLGALFHRNTIYTVENTITGQTGSFTVVTDGGPGMFPAWSYGEYQGGMSIPGAWRAASLLSNLLGGVPWEAYRDLGPAPINKITPTPPLLSQPAPPDTNVTTFSSMALDLIWEGNAIALIAERGRDGWPTAIVPVPACYVQVRRARNADFQDYGVPLGTVMYGVGNQWYTSDQVIHVKGPCKPGCLRGMGVLEAHLMGSLRLSQELQRQAGTIGAQGVPTGLLKSTAPDMTPDEAQDLKSSWMASQRDRTVAVLNETTDFQPLSWNPSETQLLDARRFSLIEVANIFGIDPSWLGVASNTMTYSNVESEAINLVKFSLGGHLARFEAAFTLAMPRGTQAKANLDALLRADTLSRYQAHEIGIRAGFLTRDEARGMEDRAPLTPAQKEELLPLPALGAGPGAPPAQNPLTPPATGLPPEVIKGNVPGARSLRAQKDLHAYWVKGAGLAKWRAADEPLVALYGQLAEYMEPGEARGAALAWFAEVMGRDPLQSDGTIPRAIGDAS